MSFLFYKYKLQSTENRDFRKTTEIFDMMNESPAPVIVFGVEWISREKRQHLTLYHLTELCILMTSCQYMLHALRTHLKAQEARAQMQVGAALLD